MIEFPKEEGEEPTRIKTCAAGFGHSAALSTSNGLYMWGFNTYGQVGFGDKKTHWYPERILSDSEGNSLENIKSVACSNYGTFCIDENGIPYSWGKGFVGHSVETMSDMT